MLIHCLIESNLELLVDSTCELAIIWLKYTGSFSFVSFDALDLYFEFLSPLFIFPSATLLNEILLAGVLTRLLTLFACLATFLLIVGWVFFTSGALVSFFVALGFLVLTLYTVLVDFYYK